MYTTWVKRLVPAPVATGTVCLTMHLTNQNKTVLDSLQTLSLQDKPTIDEQELEPKKVVPPKNAQNTGQGDGSPTEPSPPQPDDNTQQQDTTSDPTQQQGTNDSSPTQEPSTDSAATPQAAQASSVSAQSIDKDITEIIREYVTEISNKQSRWSSNPKALSSVYEIATRIKGLNEALNTYKSQKASPGN